MTRLALGSVWVWKRVGVWVTGTYRVADCRTAIAYLPVLVSILLDFSKAFDKVSHSIETNALWYQQLHS